MQLSTKAKRAGRRFLLAALCLFTLYGTIYIGGVVALYVRMGKMFDTDGEAQFTVGMMETGVGLHIVGFNLSLLSPESKPQAEASENKSTLPPVTPATQIKAVTHAKDVEGSIDTLSVDIPFISPWQMRVEMSNVDYRTPRLRVTAANLLAKMRMGLPFVFRYNVVANDVALWPKANPMLLQNPEGIENRAYALQMSQVDFSYARRFITHDYESPEEDISLKATPVILPANDDKSASATGGIQLMLDSISWRITAEPHLPRDQRNREALKAWQEAKGKMSLASLSVDLFGMNVTLNGDIELTPDLQPLGQINLVMTGLSKAYDQLGTMGLLRPDQYQALGMLVKLMPEGGNAPLTFPIKIDRKLVYFMNAPTEEKEALNPFSGIVPNGGMMEGRYQNAPAYEIDALPWETTEDENGYIIPPEGNASVKPVEEVPLMDSAMDSNAGGMPADNAVPQEVPSDLQPDSLIPAPEVAKPALSTPVH